MKKSLLTLLVFITAPSFAASCAIAPPTDSPEFCTSFQSIAQCHCINAGIPSGMCKDMNTLYKRMIAIYGTVTNACSTQNQHDTSQQECIDDWQCYRDGGRDSQGRLCNDTGNHC